MARGWEVEALRHSQEGHIVKMYDNENSLELTEEKLESRHWKQSKKKTLRVLYDNKDVVCMLQTGFGKSVIFQVVPFLVQKENCCDLPSVIVVAPLNSIMQDPSPKPEKGERHVL